MRKIFLTTVVALVLCLQNFCGAAAVTIESANFNGNETMIYPIVRTGNAAVDEKINGAILDEVNRFVKEIHYAVQNDGIVIEGLYTSFEVPCNRAGNTVILSIVMTESVYNKGAAHPLTYKRGLNFNADTGERMNTSYLTDIGSGNPKFSPENITRKLREKAEREGLMLFEEALPLKSVPEDFYFDANLHVHLLFQQYEVGPYAIGIVDLDMDA